MRPFFIIVYLVLGLYTFTQAQSSQDSTDTKRSSKVKKSDSNEMQTLMKRNGKNGAYLGFQSKMSKIYDAPAVMPGFKMAWSFARVLNMGFEVNGLVPTVQKNGIDGADPQRVLMGYGGWFIEPMFASNKLIHLTFPVSMGAGWVGLMEDWNMYSDPQLTDDKVVWVLEPGLNLELNVTKHLRFYGGGSYRYMGNTGLNDMNMKEFSGPQLNFGLKFGFF